MLHSTLPQALADVAARGVITADDVLRLRAGVYRDGVVGAGEAEWAFALDEACGETCPEWRTFFLEVLTDYVVRQEQPAGYVSEANAAWLVERIARDGVVKTASELELLVKVLETAQSSPATLSAFALRQVTAAVLDGDGPLANGRHLSPGVVGEDEVALLRRILHAFGGQGAVAVTREEAEVLFDLNDRSREADNHPAWSDLFVKAVASFLMAARGYVALPREEALRREAWLDAPDRGIAGVFGEMAASLLTDGLRGVWSAWREGETVHAERNRAVEAQTRVAEAVTADEVRWLADRIGRDGVVHGNEQALLRFLKDESPNPDPSLQALLDKAA